MKKKTSKIKKLTKGSKILIGTTTTLATAAAVILPVTMASKNESKTDPFLEVISSLSLDQIIEADEKHFSKKNREKYYSGHIDDENEMDKWIVDDIHNIPGLKNLPDKDIKITHDDDDNGKIIIDILNHGTPKHFELEGFVKKTSIWSR